MKIKKHFLNIVIFFLISVVLASMSCKMPSDAFMNTIYTISGIMFSIGMGILCTLNPDKIKNIEIYKKIKGNILNVRNTYLSYFCLISIAYILYQLFPNARYGFDVKILVIVVDVAYTTIMLNILGILYFIANFMQLQKLGFDISDKAR